MTESAYAKIRRREHEAVRKFKEELDAWDDHIAKLGLEDREDFIQWIKRNFDLRYLALFLDMDWDDETMTKRECLHKLYMDSRYGQSDD